VLFGIFLTIFGEKSIPLGLQSCATFSELIEEIICCLGDLELLIRSKAKFSLQGLNIIRLESWIL
jgi:hypothetical protein